MTLQRYGKIMTNSLFYVTFTFVFVSIVCEVTYDVISCNSFNIILVNFPDGKEFTSAINVSSRSLGSGIFEFEAQPVARIIVQRIEI